MKIVVMAEQRIGHATVEARQRGELVRQGSYDVADRDVAPATHAEIRISYLPKAGSANRAATHP